MALWLAADRLELAVLSEFQLEAIHAAAAVSVTKNWQNQHQQEPLA